MMITKEPAIISITKRKEKKKKEKKRKEKTKEKLKKCVLCKGKR